MPEDGSVDLYKALLRKAGALLARRAYSRGELRDRLSRYAGDAPLESVLTRLEELNLLNDEDYAYNFALCRIGQQGWGPARVRKSLLQRQVPAATIEGALERILNELDPATVLREYVVALREATASDGSQEHQETDTFAPARFRITAYRTF